ncbi:putative aldouronate transport system permease protein [Paenibacillus cellulosilyticus]|uniref:Putative aldouronate transport system permease protein n=2 Tax=Paenibacillus cellulosilyticus TaxID=375489 RepID=A0A2V2YV07_9BACL|nr:carbohydrate ABC transporter permease [Paenibacillus cellulosilyticus]PWW05057.1 putative aldouronate transport system permease protein [Paenibacillus cellulosilyticus]QKS48924.1 carbohydrate ABC transporter permease [Paenibacillus cellulosilyticus]
MVNRTKLRRIGGFEITNGLLMLAVCFMTLYPMWFVLVNSFNAAEYAVLGTVNWLPKAFSLDSYRVVFNNENMMHGFLITALRTIIGTVVHVLFTAIVAYGLSKTNLIGRKFYMKYALITMLFSGGLIPTFLLMTKLGLYNNFLVFIIPAMYSFFDMVIFISFFRTIPDSLEESAKVDGASDYGVLFRIVLPNSMAVIATIALFSAVYHWNDYYQGVIYIRSQELLPLQTMLYKIIAENSMSFMQQQAMAQFGARLPGNSIKFASMMVATVPILLFYPFIQRYLVKGVMIGAIKG